MAEKAKKTADGEVKTMKVEILKFHPLVVNEPGETPEMLAETAEQLIKIGYAKEVE